MYAILIWRICVYQIYQETSIVPSHLGKMRPGSRPITHDLIKIIDTPTQGDKMNFRVI